MMGSKQRQIAELKALSQLTRLALEARLTDVRRASRACEVTRGALASLTMPTIEPTDDLPFAVQARTDLLYDRWAEHKRTELNLRLARETVRWMEERAVAATAFGRNDVLGRMTEDMQEKHIRQMQRR